jgi:predicted phage-related endonuclease
MNKIVFGEGPADEPRVSQVRADVAASATISFVHDSPEWHALRARHVGGSEVAALFDLPPDQRPNYMLTRYALWHIKAGNAAPPAVDRVRTKWGLLLEEAIATAAAEEFGWSVTKGGYVKDATTPGLGCTLDYVIAADPDEDGPGALECKNVDWMVHRRAWENDEPPLHILLQLQHQLAATGYTWGVVAALIGGNDLRTYRYKARPKLTAEIRRRVAEFWQSVAEGQEPPVDGSEGAAHVLASLYPDLADDAVDLSTNNEWAEAAHAFLTAGSDRKAANDAYEEAKNRVVALMGGHKRAYGNGWSVNCAVTAENPGRLPKPGELIGIRKEVRRYSVKELAA